jgi:preprotein translocase subunit SecA
MYRIEGAELFDQMVNDIKEDTVRQILSVMPRPQPIERVQVAKPTSEGFSGGKSIVRKPVVSSKVGRNDPCPCGSGKKYKKCCGADGSEA